MSAVTRTVLLSIAIALTPAGMSGTARAEGFFEKLFGFSWSKPAPPPAPRPPAPPRETPYREPPAPASRANDHPSQSQYDSGKYRTVCVRTCDGYYFPISGAVSRHTFRRDAELCRRSCGAEAILFYHQTSNGDAHEMVDLTGRPYTSLKNAFVYRKQFVSGCKCRPEPWSASELARHKRYAAEAAASPDQPDDAGAAATTPASGAGETSTEVAAADAASTPVNPVADEPKLTAEPAPAPRASTSHHPSRKGLAPPASSMTRASARPRPRRQASDSGPLGFSFGFGKQQKLRWPGD